MEPKPISNEILLQQLRWRYATKKFDPARKITETDWVALENALVLTPSSCGLQPWKFLVITNQEIKQRLRPVSWNQTQPADCSHHVVFAVNEELSEQDVDRYLARIVEVRGGTKDALAGFRSMLVKTRADALAQNQLKNWSTWQVYIALGNFMTAAAALGIDTCPMEGIERDKYDEILGLKGTGYATAVACAAGYRDASDKYASIPKVRFKNEDVVVRLT